MPTDCPVDHSQLVKLTVPVNVTTPLERLEAEGLLQRGQGEADLDHALGLDAGEEDAFDNDGEIAPSEGYWPSSCPAGICEALSLWRHAPILRGYRQD